MKGIEALRVRSTKRLTLSRLVPVSICLCAFLLLPVPHIADLAWAESSKAESPCKEDGKRPEKELVDWCSAHGRSNERRHKGLGRPPEKSNRLPRVSATAKRIPAIVGHQLANDLCAPLLI